MVWKNGKSIISILMKNVQVENKPTMIGSSAFSHSLLAAAYCARHKLVAVGGWDGFVALCDSESMEALKTLQADPTFNWITHLAFTGNALVAYALAGSVAVWNLAYRHDVKMQSQDTLSGFGSRKSQSWLTCAAVPDLHEFDTNAAILGDSSGRLTRNSETLATHSDSITSVIVTSDKSKAISASKDHSVKIWALNGGDGTAWAQQTGEFVCSAACTALAEADGVIAAGDSLGNVYILVAVYAPSGSE